MLLQLKTSELGGGEIPPQVQRVFKSPGKIGLSKVNHRSTGLLGTCEALIGGVFTPPHYKT